MDRIRTGIEIKGSLGLIGIYSAVVSCHLMNDAHRIQVEAGASKWGGPWIVDDSVFAVALCVKCVDASHHINNSDVSNFIGYDVAHHGQIL